MIKKIIQWFKSLFTRYRKAQKTPLKATQTVDQWIVIKYHDQNICLRKREIDWWNRLGRKDRRAMAQRFHVMEKKGLIRFQEINGQTVAIKNKDYGAKADTR